PGPAHHLCAGGPVHRLRSLVLVGDGAHLAESLLHARGYVTWNSCDHADPRQQCRDGLGPPRGEVPHRKELLRGRSRLYSGGFLGKSGAGNEPMVPSKIEEFFRDARDGTLPDFALIDPDFSSNDDPPPCDLRFAQAFLASV